MLLILRHDSWGTDLVFIDLNATIKRGFANLAVDYKKMLLEIGVMVDGHCKTLWIWTWGILIC